MLHRNNVQTTSYLGLVSLSHVSIFRSSLLVSYITIFRYVFILITFLWNTEDLTVQIRLQLFSKKGRISLEIAEIVSDCNYCQDI